MAGADGSIQADAARRRLEELKARILGEIRRLLMQLDTNRGEDSLKSDREALATAQRVRAEVVRQLEEQGIPQIRDVAEQSTIDAAEAVSKNVNLGAFTPEMGDTIEKLVGARLDEVADSFKAARGAIGQAMRAGVATGASLADLTDEVARVVDTTFLKAQAAVDAAIMGAGRAITVQSVKEAADAGVTLKLEYVGPRDSKTRDFCRAIVGRSFTLAEIGAMDNGAGLDVATFGGGFNCRHTWAPVEEG